MDARGKRGRARREGTLGTFGGVFTPSILTILGLILFLRLGYVVGNAGVERALIILALATWISVQTSTSLAAIATNRKVRGGGDYYLISRSLGIAFGGGLGLVLFVAQAVSVAFYCVGFGEGVAALLPWQSEAMVPIASAAAAIVVLGLAYVGADVATRFQYVVMAILFSGLLSFFAGGLSGWDEALLRSNWEPPEQAVPFWVVFAIFFPAVTGFTQGVSMSGDLADAGRSLPRGTFLAVGLSTLVYLGAILVFGGALPNETLAVDYTSMRRVAAVSYLVDAGVLAATLSSALASALGAPRILQALAADGIFRSLTFFGHTAGPQRNPRRAVLLTGTIALLTIATGNLNAIAALVSMFFLISYGLLNYATYIEARGASPSFRPRFRLFHWQASLLGALLCAGAMLAIHPVAGVIATAIFAAIYQYLHRTAVPSRWRDSRRAYRFRRVKEALHDLASGENGAADWQPHILAFTGGDERRERLLRFASWIAGGSGVITAVHIIEGEGAFEATRERRIQAEATLRQEIKEQGLDAFPLAVAAPDLRVAASTLVQSWGVGPVRANTVLLNWVAGLHDWRRPNTTSRWYARLLSSAIRLGQSVVVLAARDSDWNALVSAGPQELRIDVWWWDDESSRLELLLAYLMTRTEKWDEARIRVLAPARSRMEKSVADNLAVRLEESRIEAELEIVPEADAEAVVSHSRDAGLVLLPLRISGMRVVDPFDGPAETLLERLPVAALVASSQDIQLTDEEEPPPQAAEAQPPEGSDSTKR
jgi:amino acid transporter